MNLLRLSILVCVPVALSGCVATNFGAATVELAPSLAPGESSAEGSDAVKEADGSSVVQSVSLEQSDDNDDDRKTGNQAQLTVFNVQDSDTTELDDLAIATETSSDRSYTLVDIEQIALGNNPALMAARAATGISTGLYQQVGTRPNPTAGYFGQQLADRQTDQHGVYFEQEFVRGNKLALNRAVLSQTNRAQQLEYETQRHRVLTDVRVRFYQALAAQQQRDATRQFAEVARQGVNVARQRETAGEGSLVETLQSQTLLSEVILAAEQADASFHGAWRDLTAIAGMPGSSFGRLSEELPVPESTPDWDTTYAEIVATSPELSAARAIVCEKQALLRRQKVQAVPNVTGQLGAGYDRSTDNGMINVQLSIPLPVHNKNCGNISAAYHEYVRATHEVNRIEQSIRSRLAQASRDYEAAMASVQKYSDEIIPQVQKSLELSESAYAVGELEFLQVLIVRRSFYESSIRLIEAKGNLAQAEARVDGLLLTGGLDSPQNYTTGDELRGASFGGQ